MPRTTKAQRRQLRRRRRRGLFGPLELLEWLARSPRRDAARPRCCVADTKDGNRCFHPTPPDRRLCGLHRRIYGVDL
jgi:hypothetical protein